MVEVYFIILTVAVVLSLPLASVRLAYAYDAEGKPDYDALHGLAPGTRIMVWILMGILFVMMVALCVNKSETIADYSVYEGMYEMGASRFNRRGVEPTFGIITILSPTFHTLLLIYAVMSVGIHLVAITKNAPNIWLSLVCYLTLDFVLHDVIQIRAGVAAALALLSIRFIPERKWWYYFPLTVTATFFHYSAIVFIPMFFLPVKRMFKSFWIAALLVALAMGFTQTYIGTMFKWIPMEFINKFFEAYIGNKDFATAGIGPRRIILCVLLIVMILRVDAIKEHYPLAIPCLCLSIFSQMCFLMFGDIPVMQGRMGELFGLADIFTLAMFPMVWRKYYYVMFIPPLVIMILNIPTAYALLTATAV